MHSTWCDCPQCRVFQPRVTHRGTHPDKHALKWGIDPHDGPRLWCALQYERQVMGDCF
jgi:hypothetical protein